MYVPPTRSSILSPSLVIFISAPLRAQCYKVNSFFLFLFRFLSFLLCTALFDTHLLILTLLSLYPTINLYEETRYRRFGRQLTRAQLSLLFLLHASSWLHHQLWKNFFATFNLEVSAPLNCCKQFAFVSVTLSSLKEKRKNQASAIPRIDIHILKLLLWFTSNW